MTKTATAASTLSAIASRDDLLNALALCNQAVRRQSTIPILQCVKIEAVDDGRLLLTTTDLDVTIQVPIAVSHVGAAGAVCVDAKLLTAAIQRSSDASVILEATDKSCEVRCGSAKFEVLIRPGVDFPLVPSREGERALLSIEADILRDALSLVSYAISNTADSSRFGLNGVFISSKTKGSIQFAATDGHRLALATIPVKGANVESILLSSFGCQAVEKIDSGPLEITVTDNCIIASSIETGRTINVRRVDGRPPDFHGVIARDLKRRIYVDRERVLLALRAIEPFTLGRTHALRIDFKPGELRLTTRNPEAGVGTIGVPIEYSGEPVTIGVNDRYFADILGALTSDRVSIRFDHADTQLQIEPVTEPVEEIQSVHVVMPMRLAS